MFHLLVLVISGIGTARAQSSSFERLVQISAQRLAIAKQVGLAKWDSGAPVEDPAREKQVIASAVKEGELKGLKGKFISSFFRAQIEANKLVQNSLLADWHHACRAPAHQPISLSDAVRPQLDKLQIELVDELANTADLRAGGECHAYLAEAIRNYLISQKHDAVPLESVALERSLAATCD